MEHSSSLRCYYPYQSVPCVCLFSHFWGQLCSGGKGYVTSSPPHSLKLREEVKPINAGRDDGPKLIWIWVNRGRIFFCLWVKTVLHTPKLRYNESRYSEFRDIVNECQLYSVLLDLANNNICNPPKVCN